MRKTAAIAIAIVNTQSTMVRHGRGSPAVSRSIGPLRRGSALGSACGATSRCVRARRGGGRRAPARPGAPAAPAVGVVVHLPGPQRREVAVAEEPEVELGSEDGSQRALLGHPGEGVGN